MALRWLVPVLGVLGGVVACTGGRSGFSDGIDTQDRAPSFYEHVKDTDENTPVSQDRPPSSQEGPGRSVEAPAGNAGGGSTAGFTCGGTYDCTAPGSTDHAALVLQGTAGACTLDSATFDPNGTVTVLGQVVAHWSASGNGFSLTATKDGGTTTITCTKVSDATTKPKDTTKTTKTSSPPSTPIDAGG